MRIILKLPKNLADALGTERLTVEKELIVRVLYEKLREINEKLREAERESKRFRNKYGMTFEEFEAKIKNGEFLDPQHHEDYVEWSFWESIKKKMERAKRELLNAIRAINSG